MQMWFSTNFFKPSATMVSLIQLYELALKFCSDGASTFTGSNSSVGSILPEKILKVIIWHCLAHRLELSANDVSKKKKGYFNYVLTKYYMFLKNINK